LVGIVNLHRHGEHRYQENADEGNSEHTTKARQPDTNVRKFMRDAIKAFAILALMEPS
jgi:hypothetical protein